VAMIILVEQPAWYISFSQGRKPLVKSVCFVNSHLPESPWNHQFVSTFGVSGCCYIVSVSS